MELQPVSEALGVEVVGLDLHAPSDPAVVATLFDALMEHHLLLFRDVDLSLEDHVRVATWFGEIDYQESRRGPDDPASFISNDDDVGNGGKGALLKHSDFCWGELLRAITLYAIDIPAQGGDTIFANAERAYQNLDEPLQRRLDSLEVLHAFDYANGDLNRRPDEDDLTSDARRRIRPAVLRHPDTGRPILYVNELLTLRAIDLGADDSPALLEELLRYLDEDDVIYTHHWEPRDLVVWDNLSLQHGRTEYDPAQRRTLRRIPIGARRSAPG